MEIFIGTRNRDQIRSHSQKYYRTLRNKELNKLKNTGEIKKSKFVITQAYWNFSALQERKKYTKSIRKIKRVIWKPKPVFEIYRVQKNAAAPLESEQDCFEKKNYERIDYFPAENEESLQGMFEVDDLLEENSIMWDTWNQRRQRNMLREETNINNKDEYRSFNTTCRESRKILRISLLLNLYKSLRIKFVVKSRRKQCLKLEIKRIAFSF